MKKQFWMGIFIVLVSALNFYNLFKDPDFPFSKKQRECFEENIRRVHKQFDIKGYFFLGVVTKEGLQYGCLVENGQLKRARSGAAMLKPIYVASHTKAMTGTWLKILEEKGAISLEETLAELLPEFFSSERDRGKISLKELLTHTHGLHSTIFVWKTAYLGDYSGREELLKDFINTKKYAGSGDFRYGNTGPILAALAVEEKLGLPWQEGLKETLFKPLGMVYTTARVSEVKNAAGNAAGPVLPSLWVKPDGTIFQSGFYKSDRSMHPAGGVISTPKDLARWLRANIREDRKLLSKKGWQALHQPLVKQTRKYFTYHRFGYSLGWDFAQYGADTLLTRFGSYGGISFHASFIPSRQLGVFAVSNDHRAALLPHLAANLAYNLIIRPDSAAAIWAAELKLFKDRFNRNSTLPFPEQPARPKEIFLTNRTNTLVFLNTSDWPEIRLKNEKGSVIMKWGELTGPVYKISGGTQTYLAALGPLFREFTMKKDSLFTGSLKYFRPAH